MTGRRSLASIALLRTDQRGAALVEFALVAPIFLTLLMGVIQVGLQVQNANAVRNLASDGARYAVVEYQRGNKLSTDQIGMVIRARGVGPRYNLNTDRLNITVTEPTSRIGGVREMRIALSYDLPDYLAFVNTGPFQVSYVRPVFLIST
jgi:hypothetical protein